MIHVDRVAIALLLFGVWLERVRRAQEGSESSKELFEGQCCACVVLCCARPQESTEDGGNSILRLAAC